MKLLSKIKTKKNRLKEVKTGIKVVSQFEDVVREFIDKSKNTTAKNLLILRYVKKDSDVLYKIAPLENSSVFANDARYLINSRAIQFERVSLVDTSKKGSSIMLKLPVVDVYEGRTEAVSHEKWASQVNLSEEFQKQMYLELSNGILEARRKSKATLKQILVYGMIAVVAFILIGSIFFK